MNFYNNEDEDKKGAPVMPSTASPFKKTSAFGKTPLFSRATGSIIDRLKNLSRKDLAFVGIGLSVLVMAPVAEYMMSQPAQDNLLKETFNPRDYRSIIDPGINGLSTGSSDGSGEVITPLSGRDPLSLILGAQPAQAALPPSAPPVTNYRDAMKESGRAAFTAATKSAGAPTVIPRMQSALRGISSFGGDSGGSRTSGTLGGGKIIADAQSASSKAKKSSMIGPVAMAGYKGVASTPNSASKGAFEKLRAQADRSAGNFSGGSAMNSLDKAAADAVNISGAGGLGAGGDSEKTGKTSGSTNKYDKSRSGETLAEAAAKARQAKALEWEFFKQYEFKKQLLTAVFGAVSTTVGKFITGQLEGGLGMASGSQTYICVQKIDPVKDCQPGNMRAAFRSADPKTVDGWINKGTCACGPMTSKEFAEANGGGTPVGPTNPAAAAPVKETFADYDITLKQMVVDIKDGVKTADAVVLLDKTMGIAGGFTNLRADSVAVAVKNGASRLGGEGVAEYERSISDAKTQVAAAKADYQMFKTKFNNVVKAANDGKLVAGSVIIGGISASIDINVEVKPYLVSASSTLALYERDYIGKAEDKLRFNDKALEIYKKQLGYVTASAEAVSSDYLDNVLKSAKETYTELDSIKKAIPANAKPDIEQQKIIVARFKAISGYDSSVVIPSSGPAAGPKDAAASNPAALIEKPITWRGLVKNEPFTKDGPNESAAVKAEQAAWAAATPLKKDTIEKMLDLNNLAAESLLAGSIRGSVEVPADAKSNAVDPKAAVGLMQPVKDKMEEVRKQLGETWKINMDNPTGGAPPTTPISSTTPNTPIEPGFSEFKTAAVSEARSSYSQAAAIKDLATGLNSALQAFKAKSGKEAEMATHKQAGQVAIGKITASHAKIGSLVAEMEACPNKACVTAKKAAIAAETAKIEVARLELQAAHTAAERIKRPAGAPTETITQIRRQAAAAYDRVVAAYGRGNTAMLRFPAGTPAKDEKKRQADEKMTALSRLYTDAGPLNSTVQNSATATAQVIAARDSLRTKAPSAETLAADIEALRTAANALLSDKCWENAEGCPTVSSFYMFRQWSVRKRMGTPWSGAYLSAWDWAFKNRTGVYRNRTAVCDAAWDSVSTARAIINLDTGINTEQCHDMFRPAFTLSQRLSPVANGGDFTSFTLAKTAGTVTKTYEGEAQSSYNGAVKIRCERQNGIWKTVAVSFRVDRPTTLTYATGVNVSAGPSWLQVGLDETTGEETTISFGEWRALPHMNGKICGGSADN